jgi:ribonuclease HII
MLYTGVDEVGYGALAGPIVAVAVTMEIPYPKEQLARHWPLAGVRDSKKTTTAQRARLSYELTEFLINEGAEVGISVVSAKRIDVLGYARAADTARKEAVRGASFDLGITPDLVVVDGIVPVPVPGQQICVPKADDKYWLVGAASILAKIYRDNMMLRAARQYPQYGWDKNMGYAGGSIKDSPHITGLVRYGLTPLHRSLPCQKVLRKRQAG